METRGITFKNVNKISVNIFQKKSQCGAPLLNANAFVGITGLDFSDTDSGVDDFENGQHFTQFFLGWKLLGNRTLFQHKHATDYTLRQSESHYRLKCAGLVNLKETMFKQFTLLSFQFQFSVSGVLQSKTEEHGHFSGATLSIFQVFHRLVTFPCFSWF